MPGSYQHIVFDFDGTIANTMATVIDIYNEYAPQYNIKPMTQEMVLSLSDLKARQVMKTLNISFYQLPVLYLKIKNQFNKRIQEVTIKEGMREIIKKLYKNQKKLYIVSSNSRENIESFLLNRDLNYFSDIYASSSLFTKSKFIKRLLKSSQISHNDTIYIGDEVRDIIASHKVGIPVMAVTWGLNNKNTLLRYQPDYIVDTPVDIMQFLK